MTPPSIEFAQPRSPDLADCYFYHRMVLPDVGEVGQEWDLRAHVEDYLGHTDFAGRRVLEIGPASGFLTAHMERAGADVVSIDLPVDYGWDHVPRPGIGADWLAERRRHMERLHSGFWFTHAKLGLKSKMIYSRVQDLPASLGPFDVSVIASVLIHCRDPMGVLCRCAELTGKRIVVSEAIWGRIGAPIPVMALMPSPNDSNSDCWWVIPPVTVATMLQVLGFTKTTVAEHQQFQWPTKRWIPCYTVVAERP